MNLTDNFEADLVAGAGRDGARRLVAGAIIESAGRILLLRRKPDDFMGGIFELPSGRVEEGESLSRALTREVLEETGLAVAEITGYLGSFDYLSRSGSLTRQFNFCVTIAGKTGKENVVLSEHDSFIWIEPASLNGLEVTDSTASILEAYFKKASPEEGRSGSDGEIRIGE